MRNRAVVLIPLLGASCLLMSLVPQRRDAMRPNPFQDSVSAAAPLQPSQPKDPVRPNPFPVRISSPASDATVKGLLEIAVEITKLPGIASIEYRLNGRELSGPLMISPYRYPWHTKEVWDGPFRLEAIARDATGRIVAKSAPVPFRVDNAGGRIRFVSPDTSKPLRGVVRWEVEVDRPQSKKEIESNKAAGEPPDKKTEAIMFFLDGRLLRVANGGSRATIELDTTDLANGRHELFASAWAFAEGIPPFAMAQVSITVDNGHVLRLLRPRWRELRLVPGQSADLAPSLTYTDGKGETPAEGVRFTSADRSVATVDAQGRVKGVRAGVTTIAMNSGDRKATTSVIVDKEEGLPHFGRDGRILRKYDPKQSLFVRTLFALSPDELERTPGLAAQAHAAEINALGTGFYLNPADGSRLPDLATWRRGWDPYWERIEKAATKHDFNLVLSGDDIARSRAELANSVTNPWSAEAIRHAFTKARDSRRVIAVEMIDEVSFLWGDTPTPTDGRWKKGEPPLPDDAFVRLMKTIDSVKGRPPICWPIGGISGTLSARNWMGNPAFSNYASQYWDIVDWRKAYPRSASLPQFLSSGMDRTVAARRAFIPRGTPELLLVSACGTSYEKRGPGDEYVPGRDLFQLAGPTPHQTTAQVMYAAAAGMAGVRVYSFDHAGWKDERRRAKVGDGGLQTGSEPNSVGTDRWQAMASSFHLIRRIEPFLLQTPMHALDLGSLIYTGARQGPDGRLLMAVNFSETSESSRVDLRPYRYAGGPAIVRYRLAGASLRVDLVPNSEFELVTLEPGESAVWLFRPKSGTHRTPCAIAFQAPLANATVPATFVATVDTANAKPVRIDFFLDGRRVSTTKAAPFTCRYEIQGVKEGSWHSLSAVAHDAAGNVSETRMAVRLGSSPKPAR